MLLASVLAIGAGSIAACGTTDCPAAVGQGESCSTPGLSCFSGFTSCDCIAGHWSCPIDLPVMPPRDMRMPNDLLSQPD